MGTDKYKSLDDMLHENEYVRNTYLDELEVAKGKELNNVSSFEEKQEIEDKYTKKMEYEEERYQTFKATLDYQERTLLKIDELRNSYKKYENKDNDIEIEK